MILVLLTLFYYVAGKLGLKLAFVNESATAVWPPTGIALAAYLILGYRIWPAILIGAFFTNFTTAGTFFTSCAIAIGNTLEGLIGAYLVNKFANGRNAFYKASDIFKFIFLAAVLSTTISANIGTLTLIIGGFAKWSEFYSIWITWWMGDATGALIVTPFFLFWQAKRPLQLLNGKKLEAAVLLVMLLIISYSLFGGVLSAYPLEFLLLPFVVWVAFRFGRRETITVIILIAGISIWGTLNGAGPFIRKSQNESLLLLQAFMGVITVTTLTIAVAISERKKFEEELQDSEQRFKALIEKSSEAVSLTDPEGLIKYVSPSFTNVLGYEPEEVIGKKGFVLIHPDDIEYAKNVTAKIVGKPGESVVVDVRCIHKDGSIRYIEITSTNLLDNPSIRAVVSNFHDITEITKTEERIMKENAEDEALLKSIGDGIVATDPSGKIILVNKAFEDMLGSKEKDILGKKPDDIIKMENDLGEEIKEKDRPLNKAFSTGKKITATHYLTGKNNKKFPATIVATPITLNKKIIGAIKILHDITREKEIDKSKTEFVSLASHQLRTPPSIVKWYSEMLINNPDFENLNDKQKKYIRQIYAAGERMVLLVNTLLTVSRLELGTFKTKLETIDIVKVCKTVLLELSVDIKGKNLNIIEDYQPDMPSVKADIGTITIIFQNLISNAVKYTPEKGTITIKITASKKELIFKISDTGYGIPENEKSKIFTRLFRADNVRAKVQEGNGLGLYIVKSLLDKAGGSVSFESVEGKGTTLVAKILLHAKE